MKCINLGERVKVALSEKRLNHITESSSNLHDILKGLGGSVGKGPEKKCGSFI